MQSGDDNVLKRMARVYSKEKYKKMVEKIRNKTPDAAITSDFIVGFPGETQEQFLNTVKVVQEIEFDACNTAAYSPRPDTPGASWENQIPEEEKNERLRYLNSVINSILEKKNKKQLNTIQEVLVEGKSQRNESRLTGRTRGNTIVNFDPTVGVCRDKPTNGYDELIGKLINIKITKINSWSMFGEVVNN